MATRKVNYGQLSSLESDCESSKPQPIGRRRLSTPIELEDKIKSDETSFIDVCRLIFGTIVPFFSSENVARKKAWCMFICIILLLLVDNAVSVLFSYVQRDLWTHVQKKEEAAFYDCIKKFLCMIVVLLPIVAAFQYAQGWFALEWRTYLTNSLLAKYFSNNAFYHLKSDRKIDNPDQRIGQDVGKFTHGIVDLMTSIADALMSLVAFSGVLFSISPMFSLALVVYAFLGTYFSVWWFGGRLMFLSKLLLGQEADFRFVLVRAREHAESIAFYRGGALEQTRAQHAYMDVLGTQFNLLLVKVKLKLFSHSFTWITYLLPLLITAPAFFRDEIEFGVIGQTNVAFGHILTALTLMLHKLDSLSTLSAEALRIQLLVLAIKHPRPEPDVVLETSNALVVRATDVAVRTPNGLLLSDNLTFECNQRLLIVGQTGCGKSSLLRVLAGLWDRGAGVVHRPINSMFVPQEAYIAHGCSLIEALSYPSETLVSEDVAERALQTVNLDVGPLQSRRDWSTLSIGEQQRLSFARVLVHKPDAVFFDEATSAVDIATEAMLYKALRMQCYVSIGHRPTLCDFHSHVLAFENGEWRYSRTSEYIAANRGDSSLRAAPDKRRV
eukprot:GEMP01016555.1.p1 GENE.GEMP01016555.1~~GEMP01016555.1.p1  ORF type:complete len:611 (+),score=107.14 GEMP01016555.1:52-1884(+)